MGELKMDADSDPLSDHTLNNVELIVARMIVSASRDTPVTITAIQDHLAQKQGLKPTARNIKRIIRELRHTHRLPIGASRDEPSGYWWPRNVEDWKELIVRLQAQPLDELTTLHRIIRANQPEMMGQLRFVLREDTAV